MTQYYISLITRIKYLIYAIPLSIMADISDVIQIHNESSDQEFDRMYMDCDDGGDDPTPNTKGSATSTNQEPEIRNEPLIRIVDDDDDEENNRDGDDEDNINITIELEGRNEPERLASLINTNPLHGIPIICNKNYSYHVIDLEIEKEIEALVRLSICPSTDKNIAILVNNQLILVPHNVRMSDRLVSYAWGHPKPYEPSNIPYAGEFNRLLRLCASRKNETFAIFGARYNNTQYSKSEREICGLHQYSEFAAIIISNHTIVDYAIHGYRSNIVDMIERHQPRRIYYNAKNDSITHFLEYKCQPFYQAFAGLLRPLRINEPNGNCSTSFNPLSFCERKNIFCALCRCLKDAYGFFNYAKIPTTVRIPQRLKNFSLLPSSTGSGPFAIDARRSPKRSRYRNGQYGQLATAVSQTFRQKPPMRFCARRSADRRQRANTTNEYIKLKRVRSGTNRFRSQQRKYRLHSANVNFEFDS